MIEMALYAYLVNVAAVAALIGQRLYPNSAPPEKGYPYAVYKRVGGPRLGTMGGASGMDQASIVIDIWARTYASAKAVSIAIRQTLNGKERDAAFGGTVTVGGVPTAYTVALEAIWMGEESDQEDWETKAHGVQLPFKIWYQEGA